VSSPSFFALIIGTEILNRRRTDKHFDFVTQALLEKGYTLTGSFVIKDDPQLIVRTIQFIAQQENAVLFSFGGIGSTPDDHTRQCAATALRDGSLMMHSEAKEIISNRIDVLQHPHALQMAMLPQNADLLENSVNQMPAFSLDERYFFMPGFPEMSHPMVTHILTNKIKPHPPLYRYTLTALCKESALIPVMEEMSPEVEFSSLPKLMSNGWQTTISVASTDDILAKKSFSKYIQKLEEANIPYGHNDLGA